MGALPVAKLSVEDYFALDATAERSLEYHDGEVFEMVDATIAHAIINANTVGSLVSRLRGSGCICGSNLVVRTTARNYVVPDITVVCGQIVRAGEAKNSVINPKVIIEILSPSTADFEHGGKFALYCKLPSFVEYVLIAQDTAKVEVFTKESDTRWILTMYEGLEATVRLESLALEIPAAEIYAGVEFPPVEDELS